MKHIRKLKKQARLRAEVSGASHQAELNAIAREHGHASWGSLRLSLQNTDLPDLAPNGKHEIDEMLDALEFARRLSGHLVVLRPTHEEEEFAIDLLRFLQEAGHKDKRLTEISFKSELDQLDFVDRVSDTTRTTIVAGSRGFDRRTSRGYFVVHTVGERLSQINALYSHRDQETIYASTAVKYALPLPDSETVSLSRNAVGVTTIRKTTLSGAAQDEGATERDDVCWVCLTPFGRAATQEEMEGSPLGGPFSSPKCQICRTNRATTQGQGSRMIMNRGIDQCLAMEASQRGRMSGPIHIFVEGAYVPLREWAASPALVEYEGRWHAWEDDKSSECPAQ